MADISVNPGYTSVAPTMSDLTSFHPAALSDHLFNLLGITGGIAGAGASTMVDLGNPGFAGLLFTLLGSGVATFGWFLGHSLWQTTHPQA